MVTVRLSEEVVFEVLAPFSVHDVMDTYQSNYRTEVLGRKAAK